MGGSNEDEKVVFVQRILAPSTGGSMYPPTTRQADWL